MVFTYTQDGGFAMSLVFSFLSPAEAIQSVLRVPSFELNVTMESDFFVFGLSGATETRLPESFYLREGAALPENINLHVAHDFAQNWGLPFEVPLSDNPVQVPGRKVIRELGKLRNMCQFAVEWFESGKTLTPSREILAWANAALDAWKPRLGISVSGGVENGPSVTVAGLVAMQWAGDIDAEREMRLCEFCGARFTLQRGRSLSGKHRTTTATRFCSHSCANRQGNQRRRNQAEEGRGSID
jgi:hypothetical protein